MNYMVDKFFDSFQKGFYLLSDITLSGFLEGFGFLVGIWGLVCLCLFLFYVAFIGFAFVVHITRKLFKKE